MKASSKIRIDRIVGGTICFPLNYLARFKVWLFPTRNRLKEPITTICVAKFVGIGSILNTLPMLKALKSRYPRARIIFVTSEKK